MIWNINLIKDSLRFGTNYSECRYVDVKYNKLHAYLGIFTEEHSNCLFI